MGADYIGWRACSLQASLGAEGFHKNLKLRAYRHAVEQRVPEAQRPSITLKIQIGDRPSQSVAYPALVEALGEFESGIPECASCPLSRGEPLGCYHYVTYPVDAVGEQVVFDYFCSEVVTTDSVANQIWRDIISTIPADDPWHLHRGAQGLAERHEPYRATFVWDGQTHAIDSAQLFAGLFINLDHGPLLVAYGPCP